METNTTLGVSTEAIVPCSIHEDSPYGSPGCFACRDLTSASIEETLTYAGFLRRGTAWYQFCIVDGGTAAKMLSRSSDPNSLKFQVVA